MNLQLYRSNDTTVPWTVGVKPERQIVRVPLQEAVHQIIGRIYMLSERLPHLFDASINDSLPKEQRKEITEHARRIEVYLREGLEDEPSAEDVLRILSQVFHLWNPNDAIGMESRNAIATALNVLGLGRELSVEETFPQLPNPVTKPRPGFSRD